MRTGAICNGRHWVDSSLRKFIRFIMFIIITFILRHISMDSMAKALDIIKARYTVSRDNKRCNLVFERRFKLMLVCYVSHFW